MHNSHGTEHNDYHAHMQMDDPKEYAKFVLVIIFIAVSSNVLSNIRGFSVETYMADFMGVFFVVFALFKFAHLDLFKLTHEGYDEIAKRFPVWGYIFPLVELALGTGYLTLGSQNILHLITIIVTATASVGVFKEITKKSKIQYACLGTFIRLPLSKVSLVEDLAMLAMVAVMIVL